MLTRSLVVSSSRLGGFLVGLMTIATSAQAAGGAEARLVHCGNDTCLRLSGHRFSEKIAIRLGDTDLPVEGGRSWQVTVPLVKARGWTSTSSTSLMLSLVDPIAGTVARAVVILPPGALGHPVQIASLTVRTR